MKKIALVLILVVVAAGSVAAQSLVATFGVGTGNARSDTWQAEVEAGNMEAKSVSALLSGLGYSHELLPYLDLYAGLHFRQVGGGTLVPAVPIVGDTTIVTRATYAYLPVRVVGSLSPEELDGFRVGVSAGPAILFRAFNNRTTQTILAGLGTDNTADTPYDPGEGKGAIGGEVGVEIGYGMSTGEIALGIRGYRMFTTMNDKTADAEADWLYYGGLEISVSYAHTLTPQ